MKSVYYSFMLALGWSLLLSGCSRPYRPQTVAKVKPLAVVAKEKEPEEEAAIQANLAKLSPEDRQLAEVQGFCAAEPENRLGCMGPPAKIMIKGQPVFLCCIGCEKACRKDEDKTLALVAELKENGEIRANLAQLGKDDAEWAAVQKFCPIEREHRLGLLGVPVKVKIKEEDVYLCCPDCREEAEKNPEKTVAIVQELTISGWLAKLSPEDRKLAELQKFCAVSNDSRLGSMGTPTKVLVKGQPVFLCCGGCKRGIQDEDKTLAVVEDLKKKNSATTPKK